MPRLDRQTFEDLSEKTGFQIDVLEKVYRLTELLKEISLTEFRESLVLKGGTAINFLFFDLPRLSVDADLDYIGAVQKEEMLERREALGEVLNRLFEMLDYSSEKDSSYALQHYDLWYENSAGNRDRVQLEINFLKRVAFLNLIEVNFDHFFDFEKFRVETLQAEELFGRKLKALVKRATARDLFDICELLKSDIEFDRKTMRKCFIFSFCLDEDPRGTDSSFIDQISQRDVRRTLLPLLRKGESVDLEEMKRTVQPLVDDFLAYTEEETEFIRRLFEERKYSPEILFRGIKFNEAIAEHPGIKWRLKQLD